MLPDPADLDVFLDGEDFAETVTLHLGTEAEPNDREVLALFDDEFAPRSQGETVMDTTAPEFAAKTADLVGVARDTMVTARGELFAVLQVQPDGTGMSRVVLRHHNDEDEEDD